MSVRLEQAVVCVTGAAQGIGAATARAFDDAGARVVLGDIDEAGAQRVADELGPSATSSWLDVADVDSFAAFVEVARALGPIDVLVNNAGIQRTGAFTDQRLEEQHREVAINLGGAITGMHLVLGEMKARGHGHVVNIASMAGKISVPGAAVYTASKFGVVSLSRAIRSELGGTGVTVTTVLPSAVRTQLTDGLDMRGLPVVAPEDIAREVVASCRHGRAEVTVPRWLASVGLFEHAIPERLGELAKRVAGAQQRLAPTREAARRYQERVSRT